MSPATTKITLALKCLIFFTNFLNKLSIKDPSVKFHGNPSIGRAELIHAGTQMDGQTW
jgi:hypothetical protein